MKIDEVKTGQTIRISMEVKGKVGLWDLKVTEVQQRDGTVILRLLDMDTGNPYTLHRDPEDYCELLRDRKFSIGAVSFARWGQCKPTLSEIERGAPPRYAWINLGLVGPARVRLLQAVLDGEPPLPEGVQLVADEGGRWGQLPITRDDVAWKTSGLKPSEWLQRRTRYENRYQGKDEK